MTNNTRRNFLKVTGLSCIAITSVSALIPGQSNKPIREEYMFTESYVKLEEILQRRFPDIEFTPPFLLELDKYRVQNNIEEEKIILEFVKNSNYMLHKLDNKIKLTFQNYNEQIAIY